MERNPYDAFWTRLTRSPRMLRPVLYELTLFRHLLVRPKLQGQPFGIRRGAATGSIFAMLLVITVMEGLPVHVLLERWNPLFAWVWSGLTLLGLLWMLAFGRALATRPISLSPRRLYLRSGLQWTGSTPRKNVQSVRPFDPVQDADILRLCMDVKPNLTLTFAQPVRFLGVYWVEREVAQVALHLDDPAVFTAALDAPPA
ncbi:hypothetical protein Dxin01_01048 [Deinococcus xinjiangensis]|uniref:PH domain-containing protein n=1 Tax=Deinococcus xinjiangensis TaxID=457454 RepID=A0ABP9V7W4_9DEIO